MNNIDASMFAPLGSTTNSSVPKATQPVSSLLPSMQQVNNNMNKSTSKAEVDLIDLNDLVRFDVASKTNPIEPNKNMSNSKESFSNNIKQPEAIKADTDKKQKSILTTLDQKKKQLQQQNETVERVKRELQRLDVPVNKEIASLRSKLEQTERELTRASKIRKQKEKELLNSIEVVTKLADEKCALTEQLNKIMYDFETEKQKKLKELEDEMKKMGLYRVCLK